MKNLYNKRKLIFVVFSFLMISVILIAIFSYQNTIVPKGIIIHHSAFPQPSDNTEINAAKIDEIHQRKGYGIFYWGKIYHIAYHYVILPDGTLQNGRPENLQGAHNFGHNDNIGICLIGEFTKNNQGNSFEPNSPTPEQMKTLIELTKNLMEKYNLDISKIHTHHQMNNDTECPGENFPFQELLERLSN